MTDIITEEREDHVFVRAGGGPLLTPKIHRHTEKRLCQLPGFQLAFRSWKQVSMDILTTIGLHSE